MGQERISARASTAADAAREIHRNAVVIDTHADTPQRFLDDAWDFTSAEGDWGGMISLESARRGNLAAEFFAVWVDPAEHGEHPARRALELTDAVLEQVRRHPDSLALCLGPADIVAARAAGKFAVLLGLEGGHAIENSLALLRNFYRLGIRYMTLTWANSNDWAESSGNHGATTRAGLSPFGREVIAEMNRLGMMIDVSHVSDRTLDDVLAITSAPLIASHSSARALTDVPRNLTDAQLRAIAATGGAVMVNFYPGFIHQPWRDAWEDCRAERAAMQGQAAAPYRAQARPVPFSVSNAIDRSFAEHIAARVGRPPFSALMAHFQHITRVAGIDHVGIGSDFDGIPALPEGIDSAADLWRITEALCGRGYTAADIHKVLGGNLLRVFHAVEAAAVEAAGVDAAGSSSRIAS